MKTNANMWGTSLQGSKDLTGKDNLTHGTKSLAKESAGTISLGDIKERPGGDTRPINENHAIRLAESIESIGLLEPLVIDNTGHLLAGGHRLAALKILQAQGKWGKPIPVRIIDFDASKDQNRALAIEVAENEQRRDYTKDEVKSLADRLQTAGFRTIKGKPKEGERNLLPALEIIVGKSQRQIQRYLASTDEVQNETASQSPEQVAEDRLRRSVQLFLKTTTEFQDERTKRLLDAMAFLVEELGIQIQGEKL